MTKETGWHLNKGITLSVILISIGHLMGAVVFASAIYWNIDSLNKQMLSVNNTLDLRAGFGNTVFDRLSKDEAAIYERFSKDENDIVALKTTVNHIDMNMQLIVNRIWDEKKPK